MSRPGIVLTPGILGMSCGPGNPGTGIGGRPANCPLARPCNEVQHLQASYLDENNLKINVLILIQGVEIGLWLEADALSLLVRHSVDQRGEPVTESAWVERLDACA